MSEENEENLTEEQAVLVGMIQAHVAATTMIGDFLHDLGLLSLRYMEHLGELIPEGFRPDDTMHPSMQEQQEPTLTLVKDDPDAQS